jgi:protoporphyrinogen oxidase
MNQSTPLDMTSRSVVVIGGGPSGLTAAHELIGQDVRTTVLEKAAIVGGIARTESYRGFHFDMGGHRFFTKSDAVNKFWRQVSNANDSHESITSRNSFTIL